MLIGMLMGKNLLRCVRAWGKDSIIKKLIIIKKFISLKIG